MIVELGLDEAAELLVDEVPILQDLLPSPDALALMRHPLPPDVHGCLELLEPLVPSKVPRFSDHASPALTALNHLLEHDEALKLSPVDVVWKL